MEGLLRKGVKSKSKSKSMMRKRDIKAEEISVSSDNESSEHREFSMQGKRWTSSEAENLQLGVEKFKDDPITDWREVSRMVGTRTSKSCKAKANAVRKTKQKSDMTLSLRE